MRNTSDPLPAPWTGPAPILEHRSRSVSNFPTSSAIESFVGAVVVVHHAGKRTGHPPVPKHHVRKQIKLFAAQPHVFRLIRCHQPKTATVGASLLLDCKHANCLTRTSRRAIERIVRSSLIASFPQDWLMRSTPNEKLVLNRPRPTSAPSAPNHRLQPHQSRKIPAQLSGTTPPHPRFALLPTPASSRTCPLLSALAHTAHRDIA